MRSWWHAVDAANQASQCHLGDGLEFGDDESPLAYRWGALTGPQVVQVLLEATEDDALGFPVHWALTSHVLERGGGSGCR
ncbi:hypothetical protein VZT92_026539 [Zoarces viviparus]|uniref:Uncharacterized protein n=1 Tax=Zoarces viviparus TaxID=48416 RepID=A0AAW1E1B1_ZOAVI